MQCNYLFLVGTETLDTSDGRCRMGVLHNITSGVK